MANGLSKIIKKARKANESNILARFAKKRFQVEELEDRIAPAAVVFSDLTKDNLALWDTAADNAADASDGVIFLDSSSTGFDSMSIENIVDNAGSADTASIAISFVDTVSGAGDATVVIGTNKAISSIDFSGITLGATDTLTVIIASGTDFTGSAGGADTLAFDANGVTYTSDSISDGTANFQNFTGDADADCDIAAYDGAIASGSIGAITLPSDGKVNLKLYAGEEAGAGTQADALSTIGAITGAGATLTTGSEIYGTTVASLSVAATEGTVTTSAISGVLTVAGNVATLNTLGIGGTTTVGGDVTALTSTTGNIAAVDVTGDVATLDSAGTLGNVTVGGDVTTTITAGTNIGNVTVTGSLADITATGGTIGEIEADTIVDITSDGNIVSIATTGAVGAGTIGTITTGDNNIGDLETNDGEADTDTHSANITGAVNLGTGNITGAWSVDGEISGAITAASVSGVVTAATGFGSTIGVNAITSTGGFTATTGDFGDTVTIGTDLDGDLLATTGNFGNVTISSGDISSTGSIIATAGSIGTLLLSNGDMAGIVDSGTTLTSVTITTGNMSGSISAAGHITSVVVDDGDLTGTITTTSSGNLVTLNVDGDISGDVTVAGTLGGTLFDADGDISSAIEANAIGAAGFDNLTSTGSIASTTTLAAITADTNIAGTITSGGNATGVITADDIPGAITIGGHLSANVIATDAATGSIDDLTVAGRVIPTALTEISAAGGAVVLTAGAIKTNGGALNITAATDVTIVVDGVDDNGDINGAIDANNGAITITSDSADAGTADNDGDIVVTTNYMIKGGSGVNFVGDDVTITMNEMAFDNGDAVIGDITADGDVTITGATDALTLGTVDSDFGAIAAITAGGDLAATALTAATGVGAISADGTLNITTITATAGGIGNVSSTGNMTVGTWTATEGNIGNISAGDADNDGKAMAITAINAVAGTVGAISATGDIAGGTISANNQIAVDGVIFSITDNDVVYTVESDNAVATDVFDFTYTVNTNSIDIDTLTRSTATALNLTLATNDADGEIVDDTFNLTDLDFAAASITAGYNKLGVLTVEGSTMGAIGLGTGSAADAIIVQNDIAGLISVDSLNVVAAKSVNSGTAATTAHLDTYTQKVSGLSDPAATVAEGSYVIPLGSGDVLVMGVASGALFATEAAVSITVGNAVDTEATVSFAAGALTGLTGVEGGVTLGDVTADMDLSALEGAININGAVSGALAFGANAGTVTIVGDVTGALTFSDMTGNVNITGDVSSAVVVGDITGSVTITGNTSGTVTIGAVTGDVTITDDVSAAVVIGDVAGTVSLGAGDDVTANVTVGDITGAGNDLILGDVAAGVTVTAGEIVDDVTIASILATSSLVIGGSDDIAIAGDMLGTITSSGDVGDITISGDFGSVISIDGDAGTITLTDDTGDGIVGSATSTLTVTGSMTALDVIDSAAAAVTMEVLFASITLGSGHLTVTNSQGDDAVGLTVPSLSLGVTGDAGDGTTGDIVIDGTTYVNVTAIDAATFGALAFDSAATTNAQTLSITNMVLHEANSGGAETIAISSASVGAIYAGDAVDVAITVDDPSTTDVNDGVVGSVTIDDDADVSAVGLDMTTAGLIYNTFNGGAAKISTGGAFAITAGSIGDIFVEDTLNFATITATAGGIASITAEAGDIVDSNGGAGITATDGNVGAITSFGIITSDITVVDGNLGLIEADGAIVGDITVDETYTFAGIINIGGGYAGTFDVEATIGDIMMSGNLNGYGAGDEDDLREDYLFDATALVSLGADFAMEGYTSATLEDVTIVGSTTYVTLAAGDLTVYNSVAGSTVTVDETDGNIATDVIVDGDLAGSITFLGDLASPGSIVDLTVDGDLSGTFTAQDDIDDLIVQGDWTGNVILSDSDMYLTGGPDVADIEVWGSVASANLSGATYTEATDKNGDALSAATPELVTRSDVYMIPNSDGDGVGQYVYVTGNVTAVVSSLFGQVSGIELIGKGGTQLVSVESDTTLEARDMMRAAKYGRMMIRGNEVANDYIDFDEPGDANLPDITVAPRVQLNSLVVDGNVGDVTDIDSNIRNAFVSGTAGDILAGRGVVNGYFGNVGDVTGQVINNIHVEGNAGTLAATRINRVDVEGSVTSATAVSINNLFVGGNVTFDLSAARLNSAFISGNVATLQGAVIANTTVGGAVGQLNVQQNFRNRPSVIKNSILADVGGTNIDFDIDNAIVNDGTAVADLNGNYTPVRIINSFVQL